MGADRQALSRRSFVRAAGAALALGALASLPPRTSLAGWDVSGAWDGVEGPGTGAGVPTRGEEARLEGEGAGDASFPTVEFGTYPQGANGEVEPVEWYVLEERDGRRLLLSKHVLDTKLYNEEWVEVTWEACTLRTWLNTNFLEEAFSAEEQARVVKTELSNPDNPDYGTPGGNTTRDRVFCLNIDEAMGYFGVGRTWDQLFDELGDDYYAADGGINHERVYAEEPGFKALGSRATDYAVSRGVFVWEEDARAEYDGGSPWWLRSPGGDAKYAASVSSGGSLGSGGYSVDYPSVGVRPALWLNP